MSVRLDVRPRVALALGAPKRASKDRRSRWTGWLGAYWLLGGGLAVLAYFDVVPVARSFSWLTSRTPEAHALVAPEAFSIGEPAAGLGLRGAYAGEDRVGTTDRLELSREAFRGVHYGGGEDPSPFDEDRAEADALASLDAADPTDDPAFGSDVTRAEAPDSIAARSSPSAGSRRKGSARSSRRKAPASRAPQPAVGVGAPLARPEATGAVASRPDPAMTPAPRAAPAVEQLDAEQARIAALSRAVDAALGRGRPQPDAEEPHDRPARAARGPARWHRVSSGPSCEGAIASYEEEIRIGEDRGPADISREQYARVLNRGSYFRHCGAPASMGLRICAAVKNGRAVGVTVWTDPADGGVGSCVASAVRGLSFPQSQRLDVTTTVFAPAR